MSASIAGKRSGLRRAAGAVADRAPWLVDGYRIVRRPTWERAIRRDLARTAASVDFLRHRPRPTAGGPVALVALYRDDIFDAKIGLLLATALTMRGFEPVVLVPTTRARRVARYAQAFGVDRVVVTSEVVLSSAEVDECDTTRAGLLATPLDDESIMRWRFRGHAIGSHVLSTVIRTTFDGAPDFTDAGVRSRVEAVLDAVLSNIVRAERVLDRVEPSVLLVEEANYAVNGPVVDGAVARGLDVIQTISTWRDDALLSARVTAANRRTDPKSVAPESFAAMAREPWTTELDTELEADFDRRYGGVRDPHRLGAELGIDPTRPTAVIFAHVLWDASHFFGDDLFGNYSDWLVRTVAAAVANPSVNWLVKTHPSNVFRAGHGDVAGPGAELALIQERFPALPDHVRVLRPDTRADARSLYAFADYGVTVRGTPGVEMPCFGKRVLTAGTGAYAGLGFTDDSESRDEFLARLASIHTYGRLSDDATKLARRYAHTLFVHEPWIPRSFALELDYSERGWHPLDRNVAMRVRSLAEWHDAGDLDHWADWVIDSDATDYFQDERSLFDS